MATAQEKLEFADLLVQVHGVNYAFGWLRSAYSYSTGNDIEDAVFRRTRDQLLLDLIVKEKADV
jgi:hypothetical protein